MSHLGGHINKNNIEFEAIRYIQTKFNVKSMLNQC